MTNAAECIDVCFKKNTKLFKFGLCPVQCPSILLTHAAPLGWTHILITGDESDDPKAANVAPRSGIRPFLEKPKVVAKTPTSRVDKLLSSMGYGSRKEMARMAKAGGITLDGADLLDVTKRIPVTPDLPTRMQIDGAALDPVAGLVVLLNKPLGMTCSHKEDGALVYDILPDRWRQRDPAISTIGRLDKQTSGLLLLTDDGDLLHRVISPKRHVKKTYRAKLARPLNGTEAALFASGQLMLEGEDKPLTPAELEMVSETEALLSVTEGRYHQVRRMFAAIGNHVEDLHRERLGGLSLPDGMAPGQWRLLKEDEIALIFQQADGGPISA